MIENSSNKQMGPHSTKASFHFSGDGVYHKRTIEAESIDAATEIWLKERILIEQSDSVPAASGEKVEDKSNEKVNE